MSKGIKLCMSCMNAVASDATHCPNCGYNGKQQNKGDSLPIGFRLAGRYVVGMRKGEDGDSVSYVGYDTTLNKKIEIREFFLHGNCARDNESMELVAAEGSELLYKTSLMDFSELYKNLCKVEGQPGIVRVPEFFEANNTAYAVVDLFDGITLREFLSMAGGTVTPEQAFKLLSPVINAVEAIHAVNLIHRGISPETIFVNRNGDIKLGGFATSQIRTKGTEVEAKLFSGYAAPEQYATTSFQGTATDVYALAAVFYRCVAGITPQDAEQRQGYDTVEPLAKVRENVSLQLSRAVAVSMLIDANERTQLASELLELLEEAVLRPSAEREEEETPADLAALPATRLEEAEEAFAPEDADEAARKKARNTTIVAVSIGVVAVVIIMVFVVWPLLGLSRPATDDDDTDVPGVEMVEVPDYVGERFAGITVDRYNFNYEYKYVTQDGTEAGVIVEQDPVAGTRVAQGSTITLTINQAARVAMPGLVGKTQEEATTQLRSSGIPYKVEEEESETFTPGVVIRQSISEGTMVNPSTQTVTIYVAKAPPQPDPPPVTDPDPTPDPGEEPGGEGEGG